MRSRNPSKSSNSSSLLNISHESWLEAEHFFKRHPEQVKYKTQGANGQRSFIKVNNEVFALANKRFVGEEKHGLLGEGGFGKVKVVQDKAGNNFAVKIEGRGPRADDDAELLIMKTIGYFKSQLARSYPSNQQKIFKERPIREKLYTITQLKSGKQLFDEIFTPIDTNNYKRQTTLSEKQWLEIALNCCKAIQYLHDQRIIHADIKPENFMSNIQGNTIAIEAIDFGLSMRLAENEQKIINGYKGTPGYIAPEIKSATPTFTFASDVYALGVTLLSDLGLNNLSSVNSMQIKNFFNSMVARYPEDRPSLTNVIENLTLLIESPKLLTDKLISENASATVKIDSTIGKKFSSVKESWSDWDASQNLTNSLTQSKSLIFHQTPTHTQSTSKAEEVQKSPSTKPRQ